MLTQSGTILVVGATGSVGTLVTAEAASRGYRVRALARPGADTSAFGDGVEVVHGDLTDSATLGDAVDGIDAVIFAHGAHQGFLAEKVDYGGVRNVLTALHGRPVRIALMTAIGVTKRSEGHDWKRRAERLVRASELPYTIVRPGWFDYNQPTEQRILMLQGDRRWASDPSDGVISRQQIAEVLVTALATSHAQRNGRDDVCVSVVADSEREMPGPIGRFLDRALERCSGRGRKQVQLATDVEPPTLSRLHPVRDDLLDQREQVAGLLGVTLADVVGGQDVGAGVVDVPCAEPGHEIGEGLRPSLVAEAHVDMPFSLRPASIAVHDDPDVAWPRDGQRCRSARRVAGIHDLTVGLTARRRPVPATVSTGTPSMGASSTPSTGRLSRPAVSLAQMSLAAKTSGAACSLPPRTPSAVAETASGVGRGYRLTFDR